MRNVQNLIVPPDGHDLGGRFLYVVFVTTDAQHRLVVTFGEPPFTGFALKDVASYGHLLTFGLVGSRSGMKRR